MAEIEYDSLGPEKIIRCYSPKTGIRAIIVVDNTALGPAIGGVRVTPGVSEGEVLRLARTMSLKNSIAGLPHGGAKAGIIAEPRTANREVLFRTFGRMTREITDYIPGPDMGSNEECMAWLHSETGRAVGLPQEIGGLPLDKVGATGFGLAECAEIACPQAGLDLKGATVAIHGFGSVGKAAARFLAAKGCRIVGVSDSRGSAYVPDGIDLDRLAGLKELGKSVAEYTGQTLPPSAVIALPCDILLPAATPDVITKSNAAGIQAKVILQGANIPATSEAELILHERGILCVPDFIANAGGVIMAAMEYSGRMEQEAFDAISRRIRDNTRHVLERAAMEKILPRAAATAIAIERITRAMGYREF